nr:stachyose synthase-like [Oryza sativa f. spontanea]
MTPQSQPIQFTLQPSSFELFAFAPITTIGDVGARFAQIGLANMLNCGGTIVDVECRDGNGSEVNMKVEGAGRLLVFSSVRPQRCLVDGFEDAFEWENGGKLMVDVSWKQDKNDLAPANDP